MVIRSLLRIQTSPPYTNDAIISDPSEMFESIIEEDVEFYRNGSDAE